MAMNETLNPQFEQILDNFSAQNNWLQSLITDPSGSRYLVEKSPAERQKEYQEQITRTRELLKYLGNPQDEFMSVHVAGTSGKGSVSTMVGALLEKISPPVDVHTSPYLQVPIEKLMINGKLIPPSKFSQLVSSFRPKLREFTARHPELSPRYGEVWVALTHLYFQQEKVAWGVIETAMGGRFDPTNVLNPEISIITRVGLDHVPQLGTTLAEIANHKAGIIKPGQPVVTCKQPKEVLAVIKEEASRLRAPLFIQGRDFHFKVKVISEAGSVVDIVTPFNHYADIKINLPGTFQPENAALAVTAADLLSRKLQKPLSKELIAEALGSVKFQGRMEKVQERPTVILDGAHNPEKMKFLAQSLEAIHGNKTFTLVIGMLSTKDALSSMKYVIPKAETVIATSPHVLGKPSTSPDRLKKLIHSLDQTKKVETAETVLEAVRKALSTTGPHGMVVVTGSIYMLGEAREYWFPTKDILWEAEYGN